MKPWATRNEVTDLCSADTNIYTMAPIHWLHEVSYTSISQSGLELYRPNESGQSHLLAVHLIGIMRYSQDQLG